ncbi:RDD family protein [Antribacter gilvus]|uniref:RDD family protein n=1 Tax=Antribacter gilvus TaxID=2304675 RepID=UPI0013DEA9D3|nr:RDD family protein [Antribacter gilvus]
MVEPPAAPRGQVQAAAGGVGVSLGAGNPNGPVYRNSDPSAMTDPETYTATQRAVLPMGREQGAVEPYAGMGKRFLAWLVDSVAGGVVPGIVLLVGLQTMGLGGAVRTVSQDEAAELLSKMMGLYALVGVLSLAYWVAMWIWEGRTGKTVGGLVLGLRTVDAETRGPIGFGRSFLRYLIVAAGVIGCAVFQLVIFFSPAWDSSGRKQGWHDKAARSVVVDVKGARAPGQMAPPPVQGRPAAPVQPPVVTAAPGGWPAPQPGPGGQPAPGSTTTQQQLPDPWAFPADAAAAQPGATTGAAPFGTTEGGSIITGVPGLSGPEQPQQASPPHQATPPQQPTYPVGVPTASQPAQQPAQHATQQPAQHATQQPAQHATQQPAQHATQQPAQHATQQPGPFEQLDSRPTRPAVHPGTSEQPSWDTTRMHVPTTAGSMSPAPVSTVELELESGTRHVVDGPALIGRNPQSPDGSPWILVKIDDPTRSVSKTHAEMGVDSAGLWLTDRGSTNGTVVSAPGLPPRVAEPGARVRVPVGSTIHLGDRRVMVHPEGNA